MVTYLLVLLASLSSASLLLVVKYGRQVGQKTSNDIVITGLGTLEIFLLGMYCTVHSSDSTDMHCNVTLFNS